MSMEHKPDKNYPFDNITLANPKYAGGVIFLKYYLAKGD